MEPIQPVEELASALVAMGGMAYFAFRYFFIPIIKARVNKDPLNR